VARPWVAGIYAREPFANEVIPYGEGARWELIQKLRKGQYDCALLLQNAFDAALLVWLAGIPMRVGYSRDARRLLLTNPIPVPKPGEIPRHERFYYLELLRRAGWIDDYPASESIRLTGAADARAAGRRRFDALGCGAVVGVSPGAAFGGAKRWLPERFAEAAASVARKTGATVVLFGSGAEAELCAQVMAKIEGVAVQNLAGQTTLAEFIEYAAACRVFLTNDSGAMHIASALGVPTVTVFGATDETATGPTGSHTRIVREPVDCSPCLLRECPIDHRCMQRVSAARVAQTALDLLK
jgi:heptosyltransferase-2